MESDRNNVVMGALMLVAGGMIGAAVALLFAPKSGTRTRRDVARYTKKMSRRAEKIVDDFADTVSDMVDTLSDKAEDIIDKGKDLTHDAKQQFVKAMADGQERLEKQRTKLLKLVG